MHAYKLADTNANTSNEFTLMPYGAPKLQVHLYDVVNDIPIHIAKYQEKQQKTKKTKQSLDS